MKTKNILLIIFTASVLSLNCYSQTPDVSPVLECTARVGVDQYIGYWGYFNGSSEVLTVPYGKDNQFNPDPEVRGQPTTFQPGAVRFVVEVAHDGHPVTWRLAQGAATSSKAVSQRCQPVCVLPTTITAAACDKSIQIDGSASGTLNNNGTLSSFSWKTDCQGTLSDTDTLIPTLTFDTLPDASSPATKCKVTLTVVDDTSYGSDQDSAVHTAECSSDIEVPPCVTDCAGNPSGTAQVDECGVCEGNGTTCLDCENNPNGGKIIDQCGVCGGDNSTCLDCNGIPNGGAVVDICNICGGDGSTCTEISSCTSEVDLCGVCGGNNSSCLDCAGIPNGVTKIDSCGVCGGDGTSCGTCFKYSGATDELKEVQKDFSSLQKNAVKYLKEGIRCSSKDARRLKAILTKITKSKAKFMTVVNVIFKSPEQVCGAEVCKGGYVDTYKSLLKNLSKALLKASVEGQKVVLGCRAPIKDNKKTLSAREINSEIQKDLKGLSNNSLDCS